MKITALKLCSTLPGVLAILCPSAQADTFGTLSNEFTIDFVDIGNPGNAPDTTGAPSPVGSVGYAYKIGEYEISRDMIAKASAAGALGLTLADMNLFGGNIVTHPATGINWNEAARFVNWLNTSRGYQAAYKFATQPGAGGYDANDYIIPWTSGDVGYDPNNLYRNSNAQYVLPSENEWYKAAYYSGNGSVYYDYATQQDFAAPPQPVASGTASGTAVFGYVISNGPANVTEAGALSAYGTMGQSGNVSEWNESAFDGFNNSPYEGRTHRGGDWRSDLEPLRSLTRDLDDPTNSSIVIGFRVASVPEPSAIVSIWLGLVVLASRRSRKPHRSVS